MKSETRNKLIAYAMHFASFLVEQGIKVRRIILFGSVASGDFDKESDIDVFVDADKTKGKTVLGLLSNFEKTFGEKWRLKGVNNQLSVTTGDINLKEWEDLRRTIQSYGVMLYGKYGEPPKNMQPYLIFSLNFQDIGRAKKVSLWRRLYGYTQKVGNKSYKSKGLLEQLGGVKIDQGVILVPAANSAQIKEFLRDNRISHNLVEVWSDQLASKALVPYVGKRVIGKYC